MTRPLDVLVIESRPGAAGEATRALESAGHHTVTCYRSRDRAAFPCRAVLDPADCPLDAGADVALLVRARNADPGPREQGASCAIRAGVPLVEAGPSVLDPYEPYLARRVEGDVVAACEATHSAELTALRQHILDLVRPVLAAAHVLIAEVTCRIEPLGRALHVRFGIPGPVPPELRQVLAVRTLDALRDGRRRYDDVSVSVNREG